MFYLIENTRFAIEALKTNKIRTFLTVLGIIIGVAAVAMIGSASRSGRTIIFKELETFGLKSLWVYRTTRDEHPGKTMKQGTGITVDDIEAVRKECDSIEMISPIIRTWGLWAKYHNNYIRANLVATNSDYIVINNDSVAKGRQIFPDDVRRRKNVCLIGTRVEEKLFEDENPIGAVIRLGDYKYTVVGVLKKKDRDFLSSIGSGGGDANNRIIIPISVYQRQNNTKDVGHIQARSVHISSAKKAAEQVKDIFSKRHRGKYQYASETMQQYVETADNILSVVSWIGSLAAIISLIVGGIGIMNIMIASVIERTREIGIRKALGARRADIMMQFLTESVLISLFGGTIGVVSGVVLILAIEFLSRKPLLLAPEYIVMSLFVSVIVGIISGIYPAIRAASMDPVDALRF